MTLSAPSPALGEEGLPPRIELDGASLALQKTYKHNSVSAVGLYGDGESRAVLKCYRRGSLLGIPMRWMGRLMARHEAAVLQQVQDIPGVPRLLGRYGRTGIIRQHVPGRPLTRDTEVPVQFFGDLFRLLHRLHRRGVAYVDLEKAENILLGEDGRPYLIDFQVAFHVPDRLFGRLWPVRWLRDQLQRADLYHARKHMRRLWPGRLSARQQRRLRRRPWFVKLANALNAPYKKLRRWAVGKE
ncbi:MAG: hypothetical protein R6V05_09025 [Candidatus Brocadiia bacterium]